MRLVSMNPFHARGPFTDWHFSGHECVEASGFRDLDSFQAPPLRVEKGTFTLGNGTGHMDIPVVGIQHNRHVFRNRVPNNMLPRAVEKNGLMGVPAEQDTVCSQTKHLLSPLNVTDVDGFIEGPQEIKRQGVCKAEFPPDDQHGQLLEEVDECAGALVGHFRGLPQEQRFKHEVVIALDGKYVVFLDQPDGILQEVEAQGITDVSQMNQRICTTEIQGVDRRLKEIQAAVAVGQQADLSWQGGFLFHKTVATSWFVNGLRFISLPPTSMPQWHRHQNQNQPKPQLYVHQPLGVDRVFQVRSGRNAGPEPAG